MNHLEARRSTVWLTRAIAYVAYAFLVVSELVLLQGFLLKLLGANPTTSYTEWAYRSLDRVMGPFRGIFTPVELDGNAVLDTSILFAMVIYGIVSLVVRTFLDWLTYRLHKLEHDRALDAAVQQAYPAVPDVVPVGTPSQPPYPTALGPASSQPAPPSTPNQ